MVSSASSSLGLQGAQVRIIWSYAPPAPPTVPSCLAQPSSITTSSPNGPEQERDGLFDGLFKEDYIQRPNVNEGLVLGNYRARGKTCLAERAVIQGLLDKGTRR